MFRRPPYRGFQQRQVSNENEASNRGRCAVDAIGECSLGRDLHGILRNLRGASLVQHDMSIMKTNLLAGIVVLLMSAGTAQAVEEPNPLELPPDHIIARMKHIQGSSNCKLDMEIVKNRIHPTSNCWEDGPWLRTSDKDHGCTEAHIDRVERQDDISFLGYSSCGSHTSVYLHTLEGPRGSNLGIYDTENY